MRKSVLLAMLIAAVVLFTSCGAHDWYVVQNTWTPEEVIEISPYGLIFDKPEGKNWWTGTYKGHPVLIHCIQTHSYVTVSFQYIEEE